MLLELKFKTNNDIVDAGISSGTWKYGAEKSEACYRSLSETTGIAVDHFTRAHQTHTDIVKRVSLADGGYGIERDFSEGDEFDGIITNEKGLMLTITIADCVPVMLLDPVHGCIGAVHSGWRGTAKEITAKAILMMEKEFGSKASDLQVCMGPCICGKCYEVGAELIDEFLINYSKEEIESFFIRTERSDETGNPKYLLDNSKAILATLKRCGVKADNITLPTACTFETEGLASWRRTHITIIQNLAYIVLK